MANVIDNLKERMIHHGIKDAEEILEKTAMAWKDNPLHKTPLQYLKSKKFPGVDLTTQEGIDQATSDVQDVYDQIKSGPKKWLIPKDIFQNLIFKDVLLPTTPDGKEQMAMDGQIPKHFVINANKMLPQDLHELQKGKVYQAATFDNVPEMVKYKFNNYVFVW